jgi:tRNA pseudouridine38-40 synthase
MKRLAVKFAYNGKGFSGYARQLNARTIEGVVLSILMSKGVIDSPRGACFRSASRTDKGVSALGNVIAFNTTCRVDDLLDVIDTDDEDLIFYGVKEVDPGFYPRYARMRVYSYYLRECYDHDRLVDVLSVFLGEHDFSNFARLESGKNPVRRIDDIRVTRRSGFFVVDFYAPNFLWHQIRRMMKAALLVMDDKLCIDDLTKALNNPSVRVNLGLASAECLLLKDVVYDFEFDYRSDTEFLLNGFESRFLQGLKTKRPL